MLQGTAFGIRISGLSKLTQTRTNTNQTMLEYIVTRLHDLNEVEVRQPMGVSARSPGRLVTASSPLVRMPLPAAQLLMVVEDFPSAAAAARVNLPVLQGDLGKIQAGVTRMDAEIKASP